MSIAFDPAEETLSGEAVAIDVQPVGLFFRVLGAAIDVLVSIAVLLAFSLANVWLGGAGLLDEATSRIVLIISIVVSLVIVPCVMETALRGRSLGKLAIGGRIVRVDGGQIGFRHAFVRAVLGVLETYFTLGAVAFLAGALTVRSQRLGDLVAGTYCQRVRRPRLVIQSVNLPAELTDWAGLADVARLPDRLGRRIGQFLAQAERMSSEARVRVAAELAAEASPFVSPLPQVRDETLLRAVVALRRERELRALQLADARVARLRSSATGSSVALGE